MAAGVPILNTILHVSRCVLYIYAAYAAYTAAHAAHGFRVLHLTYPELWMYVGALLLCVAPSGQILQRSFQITGHLHVGMGQY